MSSFRMVFNFIFAVVSMSLARLEAVWNFERVQGRLVQYFVFYGPTTRHLRDAWEKDTFTVLANKATHAYAA